MDDLEDAFIEEFEGASEQLEKKRFRNSAILFAKSLFAVCDLLIYQKLKRLPKNHTERFRILQDYFPDVYESVDSIFTYYTDAYSKPIFKETCERIRNEICKIIKGSSLPERIKKAVG